MSNGAISMKIKAFLIAVAVCLSLPVAAEFKTVAPAYEVPLKGFNIPIIHSGMITFSECEACPKVTGRLTGQTRFLVNDIDVDLTNFRRSIFQMHDLESETITIVHHLESGTIKSISVTL